MTDQSKTGAGPKLLSDELADKGIPTPKTRKPRKPKTTAAPTAFEPPVDGTEVGKINPGDTGAQQAAATTVAVTGARASNHAISGAGGGRTGKTTAAVYPDSVTLASMYSFFTHDDPAHPDRRFMLWQEGAVETDPEAIRILVDRKAPIL